MDLEGAELVGSIAAVKVGRDSESKGVGLGKLIASLGSVEVTGGIPCLDREICATCESVTLCFMEYS